MNGNSLWISVETFGKGVRFSRVRVPEEPAFWISECKVQREARGESQVRRELQTRLLSSRAVDHTAESPSSGPFGVGGKLWESISSVATGSGYVVSH